MPIGKIRLNVTRVVAICVTLFMITGFAFPASAQTKDLSDIYFNLKPSVVTIKARVDWVGGGALGSGVIVDKQGRIMTAAHVVHAASQIEVQTVAAKLFDREVFLGGGIIISIHGTSCDEPHDFARIQDELSRLKQGDPFVIEVLRNGLIVSLHGSVRHSDLIRGFSQ